MVKKRFHFLSFCWDCLFIHYRVLIFHTLEGSWRKTRENVAVANDFRKAGFHSSLEIHTKWPLKTILVGDFYAIDGICRNFRIIWSNVWLKNEVRVPWIEKGTLNVRCHFPSQGFPKNLVMFQKTCSTIIGGEKLILVSAWKLKVENFPSQNLRYPLPCLK